MKELDFDELDRAVSSLMGDVSKGDLSTPKNDEKTLEINPTLPSSASVTPPTPAPTVTVTPVAPKSDIKSTPRVQTPPLAARRGGRFMDVVHPSSDMKKTVPSTRPVSRQGVQVEPRADATHVLASPSTPEEVAPAKEPDTTPRTAFVEKTAPANEWPDPLEMSTFTAPDSTSVVPSATEEVAHPDVLSNAPQVVVSKNDDIERAPLTSPFLPDAKVEKRPLGADPATTAEEPDRTPVLGANVNTVLSSNDSSAQLPATPQTVEPQLPEELQGDLMAIESDTHMGLPKTEESHPSMDTHEVKKAPTKVSMPSLDPPEELLLPAGPTSIPQQYREEPNTGDASSGAIYDTDNYHQPLAHPAKKKSGWLWVVWILIILIVGAGAGAALYFLHLV